MLRQAKQQVLVLVDAQHVPAYGAQRVGPKHGSPVDDRATFAPQMRGVDLLVPLLYPHRSQWPAVRVCEHDSAADHHAFWMLFEVIDLPLESVWRRDVVSVHPRDVPATHERSCFVEGFCDARVGSAAEPDAPVALSMPTQP